MIGRLPLAGLACLLASTLGCGLRRDLAFEPPDAGWFGVYRARIEQPDQRRKFRLLLYAAPPDRLHGEVLSPLGRTELIIDGGSGRLSVAIPPERTAYVGAEDPAWIERVIGVPIPLGVLVRSLFYDEAAPNGLRIERSGAPGELPLKMTIGSGDRSLSLERKRRRKLDVSADRLGRGEPPAGFSVLPLEEMQLDLGPAEAGRAR